MKLSCIFNKNQLVAYVDHELTPQRAARVEQHLRTCASCALTAAELRQLNSIAPPAAIQPSADFDRLFWTRLAQEREKAGQNQSAGLLSSARSFFTRPAGLSLSAGLALAIFVVSLYFMRPPDPVLQQPEFMAAADLDLYANLEIIENSEALENFELIEMLDELQQDEQG